MSRFTHTLEEDLRALPMLLPSEKTVEKFGDCLRAIQAASSAQALANEYFWTLGYVQALKDLEFLSAVQAPDLRELVFRAKRRCAIK